MFNDLTFLGECSRLNAFSPTPDSESGTQTSFIKLVLEVKLCINNERREVSTTHLHSTHFHIPRSEQIQQLFFVFYKSLQHNEEAQMLHAQGGFLAEVFVDDNNDFYPNVADSLY